MWVWLKTVMVAQMKTVIVGLPMTVMGAFLMAVM